MPSITIALIFTLANPCRKFYERAVNFSNLFLQNDDFTDKVICLCLVLPNMLLCSFRGGISRKTIFKMRNQFPRIVGKPSLGQFSLKEDSVGEYKHKMWDPKNME